MIRARANIPLLKKLEEFGSTLLERAKTDENATMGECVALLTAMGKIAALREEGDDDERNDESRIKFYRDAIAANGAGRRPK